MTQNPPNLPVVTQCAGVKAIPGVGSNRADKELAKNSLAVTLGALVVTGLMRTPQARAIHMLAGAALIGLSVWHHLLYQTRNGAGR